MNIKFLRYRCSAFDSWNLSARTSKYRSFRRSKKVGATAISALCRKYRYTRTRYMNIFSALTALTPSFSLRCASATLLVFDFYSFFSAMIWSPSANSTNARARRFSLYSLLAFSMRKAFTLEAILWRVRATKAFFFNNISCYLLLNTN